MITFTVGNNIYVISGEITRQFHDTSTSSISYHAYKNGWYVRGSTGKTEEECFSFLSEIEKWNNEILNKIKKENINEFTF